MKITFTNKDMEKIVEIHLQHQFKSMMPPNHKMVVDIKSYETTVEFVPDVLETFAARTEAILEGE